VLQFTYQPKRKASGLHGGLAEGRSVLPYVENAIHVASTLPTLSSLALDSVGLASLHAQLLEAIQLMLVNLHTLSHVEIDYRPLRSTPCLALLFSHVRWWNAVALTRHDTTRHDTTRHDTTRHDTTRHDTTRTQHGVHTLADKFVGYARELNGKMGKLACAVERLGRVEEKHMLFLIRIDSIKDVRPPPPLSQCSASTSRLWRVVSCHVVVGRVVGRVVSCRV
jgi:hypothetical protein